MSMTAAETAEEEKRRKDTEERAKAMTIDGTGKSAKPRVAAVFIAHLRMPMHYKGLAFVDDTNCIYGPRRLRRQPWLAQPRVSKPRWSNCVRPT